MNPEEIRAMLASLSYPLVILTKGGRSYTVRDPASAWIPPDYPTTVVLSLPHQGLTLLAMSGVESVVTEHEAVPR
jgi:hypothetical protein